MSNTENGIAEEVFAFDAPCDKAVKNSSGGLHIPINDLEDLLDYVEWGTRNYVYNLQKDADGNYFVSASLELVVRYTIPAPIKVDDMAFLNELDREIERTFVGACNFYLADIYPIRDWNATAKSLCIKNAASDIGRVFGRGLNAEVIPERGDDDVSEKEPAKKLKADDSIKAQYARALEKGNVTMTGILEKIYDLS